MGVKRYFQKLLGQRPRTAGHEGRCSGESGWPNPTCEREPRAPHVRHKDRRVESEIQAEGLRPQKGFAVTAHAPGKFYVLLKDEEAAGRIIVELDAFVRFDRQLARQLRRLQRRTLKKIPQLLNRGIFGRPRRED